MPKLTKPMQKWFTPGDDHKSSFKQALEYYCGVDGSKMLEIISSIAQGKAWVPVDPEGRVGPPVIPSTADRFVAAKTLLEFAHGKAVAQTKLVEAELAARASRTLDSVDTKSLEEEYLAHLQAEGRIKIVEAAPLMNAPQTVDAEYDEGDDGEHDE